MKEDDRKPEIKPAASPPERFRQTSEYKALMDGLFIFFLGMVVFVPISLLLIHHWQSSGLDGPTLTQSTPHPNGSSTTFTGFAPAVLLIYLVPVAAVIFIFGFFVILFCLWGAYIDFRDKQKHPSDRKQAEAKQIVCPKCGGTDINRCSKGEAIAGAAFFIFFGGFCTYFMISPNVKPIFPIISAIVFSIVGIWAMLQLRSSYLCAKCNASFTSRR